MFQIHYSANGSCLNVDIFYNSSNMLYFLSKNPSADKFGLSPLEAIYSTTSHKSHPIYHCITIIWSDR